MIEAVIVPATCPLKRASIVTAFPVLLTLTSSRVPFEIWFRTVRSGEFRVVCCDSVAHLSPGWSIHVPPPDPDTPYLQLKLSREQYNDNAFPGAATRGRCISQLAERQAYRNVVRQT